MNKMKSLISNEFGPITIILSFFDLKVLSTTLSQVSTTFQKSIFLHLKNIDDKHPFKLFVNRKERRKFQNNFLFHEKDRYSKKRDVVLGFFPYLKSKNFKFNVNKSIGNTWEDFFIAVIEALGGLDWFEEQNRRDLFKMSIGYFRHLYGHSHDFNQSYLKIIKWLMNKYEVSKLNHGKKNELSTEYYNTLTYVDKKTNKPFFEMSEEHFEIFDFFLKKKVLIPKTINCYAGKGLHRKNLLHVLCEMGAKRSVIRLLKEKDLEFHRKRDRKHVLQGAVSSFNLDIIKLILDDPRCDKTLEVVKQVIRIPVFNDKPEVLKLLLKYGFDPSINNNTMLYVALDSKKTKGAPNVLKVLLSCESVIKKSKGRYPLLKAVRNGYFDSFELFYNLPNVDLAANNNELFRRAASDGHTKIVKLLLKRPSVSISANDYEGFKFASKNGREEIVKLLLERKDLKEISGQANFAIRQALYSGHINIIKMLLKDNRLKRDSSFNECLLSSIKNNYGKEIFFRTFYEEGIIPNLECLYESVRISRKSSNGILKTLLKDKRIDITDNGKNEIVLVAVEKSNEILKIVVDESNEKIHECFEKNTQALFTLHKALLKCASNSNHSLMFKNYSLIFDLIKKYDKRELSEFRMVDMIVEKTRNIRILEDIFDKNKPPLDIRKNAWSIGVKEKRSPIPKALSEILLRNWFGSEDENENNKDDSDYIEVMSNRLMMHPLEIRSFKNAFNLLLKEKKKNKVQISKIIEWDNYYALKFYIKKGYTHHLLVFAFFGAQIGWKKVYKLSRNNPTHMEYILTGELLAELWDLKNELNE